MFNFVEMKIYLEFIKYLLDYIIYVVFEIMKVKNIFDKCVLFVI